MITVKGFTATAAAAAAAVVVVVVAMILLNFEFKRMFTLNLAINRIKWWQLTTSRNLR